MRLLWLQLEEQDRLWLVAANPETTLKELLGIIVRNSVHRVYIVDEHIMPLGVVTLTDIMQLFAVDPAMDEEGWLDLTIA